jgi:hypothetical protein
MPDSYGSGSPHANTENLLIEKSDYGSSKHAEGLEEDVAPPPYVFRCASGSIP